MRANFILKMKDFWRKNKTKIIIALLIWLVIVIINYILKNVNVEITPKTTYEPHTAIMDDSKVPEKLQNPIEELISKYINYCNNKEYENAYNMLLKAQDLICQNSNMKNIHEDILINNMSISGLLGNILSLSDCIAALEMSLPKNTEAAEYLSLIHISEPTRRCR